MKPLYHEPGLLIAKIESTVSIRFSLFLTLLIFTANVVRAGAQNGAQNGAPTEVPTEPRTQAADKRPDPRN